MLSAMPPIKTMQTLFNSFSTTMQIQTIKIKQNIAIVAYRQTGRNTLHIACFQGCNEVVEVLVNSGKVEDINARTQVTIPTWGHHQDNRDVLSLAISGGCNVRTVAELVFHGASLNVVDEVLLLVCFSPS